jgi:hypothetical protein
MANTTNFGWETPDDTDLVKDGAAAIRTLGSAIDTSLVDLKGGTTGQVLAKASNTDMDFTWVADAGFSNPMTTTGDIIYSSSGSTPARLGIGSTGQILTVTGGAPAWATPAGGGKILQVVTATTTTSTNLTTSYADITNMTVTITPTKNTSTIMILWSSNVYGSISSYDDALPTVTTQLFRGATSLATNRVMSNESSATGGNGRNHTQAFAFHYIDNPATTSATTYKFQAVRTNPGGTTTANIGGSYQQTITAFEIGA